MLPGIKIKKIDKFPDERPPTIKYLKEGTKITCEGKNLNALDAYKFEW